MTVQRDIYPLLALPDGDFLFVDDYNGRRLPLICTSFPNVTSSIGKEGGSQYGFSWVSFTEYNGSFSGRFMQSKLLTQENSNIPVSPFLTLQSIRTDAARSFWLCCMFNFYGQERTNPTSGECSIFGKKYSYADCRDPINLSSGKLWKIAYIEINADRRVFVDGVDTGIWRTQGVIHEM